MVQDIFGPLRNMKTRKPGTSYALILNNIVLLLHVRVAEKAKNETIHANKL